MDTPTLRHALRASQQEIKDVVRHDQLGIKKGTQGSLRDWSRDEAVLIGYYLAARKAGASIYDAARIARVWVHENEIDCWIFNSEEPLVYGDKPAGDFLNRTSTISGAFQSVSEPENAAEWTTTIGKNLPPAAIVVVNLAGIRERIDSRVEKQAAPSEVSEEGA